MNDIEMKYKLPFGPDIIIDGTGKCLTPKQEPYFRVRKPKQISVNHKNCPPIMQATKAESTFYGVKSFIVADTYTVYTSALILIMMCLIVAFLCGVFQSTKYDENTFSPDTIPDYALEAAGASIYKVPDATPYTVQSVKYKKTFLLWKISENHGGPESILQPWRSAGECWAFAGQQASVQIRLSHTIIPRAVTVEHISKSLSPTGNILSAPRKFSVYTVDIEETVSEEHLGSFEYRDNGETIQSFLLFPEGNIRYPARIIEIQFHSNHGNPKYTCVYKIRVHGDIFV